MKITEQGLNLRMSRCVKSVMLNCIDSLARLEPMDEYGRKLGPSNEPSDVVTECHIIETAMHDMAYIVSQYGKIKKAFGKFALMEEYVQMGECPNPKYRFTKD